jgi:hypothetical protein
VIRDGGRFLYLRPCQPGFGNKKGFNYVYPLREMFYSKNAFFPKRKISQPDEEKERVCPTLVFAAYPNIEEEPCYV